MEYSLVTFSTSAEAATAAVFIGVGLNLAVNVLGTDLSGIFEVNIGDYSGYYSARGYAKNDGPASTVSWQPLP